MLKAPFHTLPELAQNPSSSRKIYLLEAQFDAGVYLMLFFNLLIILIFTNYFLFDQDEIVLFHSLEFDRDIQQG